jgi:hypothetical protein
MAGLWLVYEGSMDWSVGHETQRIMTKLKKKFPFSGFKPHQGTPISNRKFDVFNERLHRLQG